MGWVGKPQRHGKGGGMDDRDSQEQQTGKNRRCPGQVEGRYNVAEGAKRRKTIEGFVEEMGFKTGEDMSSQAKSVAPLASEAV